MALKSHQVQVSHFAVREAQVAGEIAPGHTSKGLWNHSSALATSDPGTGGGEGHACDSSQPQTRAGALVPVTATKKETNIGGAHTTYQAVGWVSHIQHLKFS